MQHTGLVGYVPMSGVFEMMEGGTRKVACFIAFGDRLSELFVQVRGSRGCVRMAALVEIDNLTKP